MLSLFLLHFLLLLISSFPIPINTKLQSPLRRYRVIFVEMPSFPRDNQEEAEKLDLGFENLTDTMSRTGPRKLTESDSDDEALETRPAKVPKTDRMSRIEISKQLLEVSGNIEAANAGLKNAKAIVENAITRIHYEIEKCAKKTDEAARDLSACNWAFYTSHQNNERLEKENAILRERISMLEARLCEKED
ncbi:hypothetical protein F4811DRAFT_178962 [Daldinia bambusicola]|nr:hypothetical protein F4811DRAFT_178962 [Daldinia bambusicola]